MGLVEDKAEGALSRAKIIEHMENGDAVCFAFSTPLSGGKTARLSLYVTCVACEVSCTLQFCPHFNKQNISTMEPPNEPPELLQAFVEDLVSLDDFRQKRALETYFFPDVIYSSTLITTQGVLNLRRVFHTWSALNKDEPNVENIVFDGQTCIIHLRQNIRPRVFPVLYLAVPTIITLHFRADDNGVQGFYKVWKAEENWTLEGLLQSVPLLNWWYENVVRVIMGKVVTGTGDFIYAASQTAHSIGYRSRELHITANDLTRNVGDRVHKYREDLQNNLEKRVEMVKMSLEEKANGVRLGDMMVKKIEASH